MIFTPFVDGEILYQKSPVKDFFVISIPD